MDGKTKLLSKRTLVATLACVFMVAFLACGASVFGLFAPRLLQETLNRSQRLDGGLVIRIDKPGYLAGETVRISGAGFSPFERVMLRVGHASGTVETGMGHEAWFINANSSGAFNATWTLSANDMSGVEFVLDAAGSSGLKAKASFARRARMSMDGSSYRPGDMVRITADGFNPNETVTLEVNHQRAGTAVSDKNGRVNTEVELPADDFSVSSFSITATGSDSFVVSSLLIPLGWVTVYDQQGPNDYPGQNDLTMFARNDDDTSVYRVRWNWDSTDMWTGTGQTGDACALFDSNGDGHIELVVCGQIHNPNADPSQVTETTGSPFVYTCNNTKIDRCGGPTPVPYTSSDIQAGLMNTL